MRRRAVVALVAVAVQLATVSEAFNSPLSLGHHQFQLQQHHRHRAQQRQQRGPPPPPPQPQQLRRRRRRQQPLSSVTMAATQQGSAGAGADATGGGPSSASAGSAPATGRASAGTRMQVITDIDDTVKSSGGVKLGNIPLGGIDTQYTRGKFYPGVFRFMLALAEHELPPDVAPLRCAVLTARAREFLWALQLTESDPICTAFRNEGGKAGYANRWGIGTVLYGSVQEWILQHRKGWRKFENFKLLRQECTAALLKERAGGPVATGPTTVSPEEAAKRSVSGKDGGGGGGELGVGFTGAAEDNGQNGRRMTSEREKEDTTLSYIFVGDVGELDREAGELMLIKYPRSMRALFLHVVSSEPDPPLPQDILINGLPVLHFRTYVQAAVKAVAYDLMSLEGLREVIERAVADLTLQETDRTSSKWTDLQADIREAKQAHPSLADAGLGVGVGAGRVSRGNSRESSKSEDPQMVPSPPPMPSDVLGGRNTAADATPNGGDDGGRGGRESGSVSIEVADVALVVENEGEAEAIPEVKVVGKVVPGTGSIVSEDDGLIYR